MSIPTPVVSEPEWRRVRGADITPFGRQEEWQDAPEGVAQDPTYSWSRRHDEYAQKSWPEEG